MLGHWTYLAIILPAGLAGLWFTWLVGRTRLAGKARSIALIVAGMTLYLVMIDLVAIRGLHIWWFRPEMVTGVYFFGDYLEEWILFVMTQTFIVGWAFILKCPNPDPGRAGAPAPPM